MHNTNKPIYKRRGRNAEEESLALKNALSIANSRLSKLESLEADAASRAMEIQVRGHSSSTRTTIVFAQKKLVVVGDGWLCVGERRHDIMF